MSKSNTKKSIKTIIIEYLHENAEYFDCVSSLISGVEHIPYPKD